MGQSLPMKDAGDMESLTSPALPSGPPSTAISSAMGSVVMIAIVPMAWLTLTRLAACLPPKSLF